MKYYLIFIACSWGIALGANAFWNNTYFKKDLYGDKGFSINFYHTDCDKGFNSQKESVDLLAHYGVVQADTLGLDSMTQNGFIAQPLELSTVSYNALTTITNVLGQDRSTFGNLLYSGKVHFSELYFKGHISL